MIPIPIPLGKSFEATLTGRVPKFVCCERCGQEYVYLLETSAVGRDVSVLFLDDAGAEKRAESRAYAGLRSALETECAVVPCISCGHVQQHMLPQARRMHRNWMKKAAIVSFGLGGFLVLPAMVATLLANGPGGTEANLTASVILWSCSACLLSAAIGFPLLRSFLARGHDPNALPVELRKQWGESSAVSNDEFMRMVQRQREADTRRWRCFKCDKEVHYQDLECPHCGYRLEVGGP
jgi:hypothetical protein